MAEEVQPREYREFDMKSIVIGTANGGDFADYAILETEEPFKAFVQDIKLGSKFNRTKQLDEDRVFVWCEMTDGEGKGQRYRADFNAKISPKGSNKPTALSSFLDKVYPDVYTAGIDKDDLLGQPVRIELSAAWKKPNDTTDSKGMQFIETFKKATADQKRTKVEAPVATDVVLADLPDGDLMTSDELDKLFK